MADSPIRSADKAYYRSKQPLNLNKLREGRKNAAPNPSYKQRMNDSTASSNKYYQSAKPVAVEAPVEVEAVKAKPKKVVKNYDSSYISHHKDKMAERGDFTYLLPSSHS